MPPVFVCLLYICMPPYVCMPPRGVHPLMCPILPCASVCSQRLLHVVGVVRVPLHVGHFPYTSPCMGSLPICLHSHSFVGFPVHQYVFRIYACDMGNICLMLEVGVCFPICWGFGGHQHLGCPYAFIVHSSCMFL